MNITIVASKFLPALGGVEIAVWNLAKEWKRQGHSVQIITNRFSRNLPQREVIDGVGVYRFFYVWGLPPMSVLPILKFLVQVILIPLTFGGTWLLFRRHKTHVVNLHFVGGPAPYVYLLSYLFRCKYVVSLHGDDVEADPFRSRVRMVLLENLLKRADLVTINSKYLEQRVTTLVSGVREKLAAIGNGVDIEEIGRIPAYTHRRPYVLGLGRLVHKKGMDVLVQAFALLSERVKDLDLIIGGHGPEEEKIRILARELRIPDRVVLWGETSRFHSIALIKGAEVLVVPSRREPFGIIVLEGAVSGKPVVATRVGGIPELAQMLPNVELVEPQDPVALKEKIEQVMERKNYYLQSERLKETARVLSRRYSWRGIALSLSKMMLSP